MGKKGKGQSGRSAGKQGRVLGGLSRMRLSDDEEACLLEMLALLDDGGATLVDESSSGNESDDNENDATNEAKRQAQIRKLIRNERRASKEESLQKLSDKKTKKQLLGDLKGSAASTAPTLTPITGAPTTKVTSTSTTSPQLRIHVSCEGKAGPAKLLLVERSCSLEDLLNQARNKFTVGRKFSVLQVSIRDRVRNLDLSHIADLENDCSMLLSTRALPEVLQEEETDESESDESVTPPPPPLPVAPAETSHPAWSVADIKRREFDDAVYISSPRRVDAEESAVMKMDWARRQESLTEVLAARRALPIYNIRDELQEMIRSHQVCVVSGETGSGKTTQTVQYILEDMIASERGSEAYIVCTQPRRIAAISIAERVAYERGETVGASVGYQVRLNSRVSASTRIVYCTTGVLLRRLHNKDFLASASHILIDEVHERQVDTDFLMAQLKQMIQSHPELRVVLMSATLQEKLYCDYFSCPVIYVTGRTFPVQVHYLQDILGLVASGQRAVAQSRGKASQQKLSPAQVYDGHLSKGESVAKLKLPKFDAECIAEIVIRIIQKFSAPRTVLPAVPNPEVTTGDAILVFLSGIQAIEKVNRALRQRNLESLNAVCYTLHGSLSSESQRKVFKTTAPGEWKIILSTNIAETSVTVDDVTHVIDVGLVKEMMYDASTNISSLQEVYISRAAGRQRAGRAGRVRAGHAWRVYTEEWFLGEAVADFSIPEIRRIPLDEVVLQVLLLDLGLPTVFLSSCIEPPSVEQIKRSVQILLEIKAVLPQPALPLTALGYHLAKLPLDVHLGKMLIVGSLLQCIEPVLTIAAALGGKSPFTSPVNLRDAATNAHKNFKQDRFSDHLAIVEAYNRWRNIMDAQGKGAASAFCHQNFLSAVSLEEIHKLREHFRLYLKEAGFLPSPEKMFTDDIEAEAAEVGDGEDEDEALPAVPIKCPPAMISSAPPIEHSSAVHNELVKCVLAAGLFPQIMRVCRYTDKKNVGSKGKGRQDLQPIHILQADETEAFIHPMSLTCKDLSRIFDHDEGKLKEAYLAYYKKVASTNKVYIYDCTAVPVPAMMLFGGELSIAKSRDRVIIDGWIQIKASELHAALYKRLQREIESMLIQRVESPQSNIFARQTLLIQILTKLLE